MRTQKNVLVVDDSATMRRMVMATLQRIEGSQLRNAGAMRFLGKPAPPATILEAVTAALAGPA